MSNVTVEVIDPEAERKAQEEAEAIIRDAMRFRAWFYNRTRNGMGVHATRVLLRRYDQMSAEGLIEKPSY